MIYIMKTFLIVKYWFIKNYLLLYLFKLPKEYEGISIYGSSLFMDKIVSSLELIKEKIPEEFEFVKNNIKVIIWYPSSCARASMNPSTVCIGYKSFKERSIEEIAGTIGHEAFHCFLFNKYKKSHPDEKVPREIYSGEDAERQCLTYSLFDIEKKNRNKKDL